MSLSFSGVAASFTLCLLQLKQAMEQFDAELLQLCGGIFKQPPQQKPESSSGRKDGGLAKVGSIQCLLSAGSVTRVLVMPRPGHVQSAKSCGNHEHGKRG
jgi:hypothetical protein